MHGWGSVSEQTEVAPASASYEVRSLGLHLERLHGARVSCARHVPERRIWPVVVAGLGAL